MGENKDLNERMEDSDSQGFISKFARGIRRAANSGIGKATGWLMLAGTVYGISNKIDYNPNQGFRYEHVGEAVADGMESVVTMYEWDGVCTKKDNYRLKIPSGRDKCYALEKDDFLKKYNSNNSFRELFKNVGLNDIFDYLCNNRTDSITSVRITESSLDIGIETDKSNYSDMIVNGKQRYFVTKSIKNSLFKALKPYFE